MDIDKEIYDFNDKLREECPHLIGCFLISDGIMCNVDVDTPDTEFDEIVKNALKLLHKVEDNIGEYLSLYIKRV